MVKNKRIEKGTKQVTNPRYESWNSKLNSRCPPHSEALDQRLPSEFPLVNIVVHQVPSENPNQEYFKITWQKENERIHCETSLSELSLASASSLEQFGTLLARCASTGGRGAAHRLQSTITDNYIAGSRTDAQTPHTVLQEPIRTNSRKEGKCITHSSSRKQREPKKQCKDNEELQCVRELVEGEDSEDDEEVDYIDGYQDVEYSNTDEFTEYYDKMFRMVGQLSLKKILKCWIKKIHPKKQTQHPYNGGKWKESSIKLYGKGNVGEQTKPPWWPPSLESKEWERSRHKEPDHQKKPERLVLALWLLRYFNVEGLQESTSDIAPSLGPKFQETVPKMLEEIYRIRQHEAKLIKSDCYSGGNSTTWIRSSKLKGSIKKINHPPPPSRQSMELPFVQHTSFTSRSPTPQPVLQVLEPVVEQAEHQPMPYEEISPLGDTIDEDQFLLTDESLVEQYHPERMEQIVPEVSSNFFLSPYQEFSEDLLHSERPKVKQATLFSSNHHPKPERFWDNVLPEHHGMPQPSQRAWGNGLLPIAPIGPPHPEISFCPNPFNLNVDEQPHRQPRQFHTQQEYNARLTRNPFQ